MRADMLDTRLPAPGLLDRSASGTCWNDSSPACARDRAACWCSTARQASARPPCWSSWRQRRDGMPDRPGGGRRVGDGARLRRPARAVRAHARPSAASAGAQRDALSTAFGLSAGPPPDRFLVGLAVLSLLADVAEEQPLVCIVDDAQWLDRVSAQTLAFVARRLLAERVGLVFARARGRQRARARGLAGARDRRADRRRGPAAAGRDDPRAARRAGAGRILAEAGGNPLALLELPRGLTARSRADTGCPAVAVDQPDRAGLHAQLEQLPAETRRLLLLAAAEPVGDVTLLWRAAELLGIGHEAAGPAQAAGLVEIGARVRFRHPLVRSAAYRAATAPSDAMSIERSPGRPIRSWIPIVAPGIGPRGRGSRRGGGRRARALGRPGAGARRPGRGGGVPRASDGADAGPARRGVARWPPRRRSCAPARRARSCCSPPPRRPARRASRARIDLLRAEMRSRSTTAATRCRCCSPRRAGSSRSTTHSRARRISRRSGRDARRSPARRGPRGREPRPHAAGADRPRPVDLLLDGRPRGTRTATPPRSRSAASGAAFRSDD